MVYEEQAPAAGEFFDCAAPTSATEPVLLPAQRGKTPTRISDAANGRGGDVQQVYAPGFKAVVNVPAAAVRHMPAAALNVTRLVLCANYDAAKGDASCAMGARCKFVHADTSGITIESASVHVNYAWRHTGDCVYRRYAPGETLRVAAPNGKRTSDVMDSSMALKTNALASKRRPLTHCAHYYYSRQCDLGSKCQFVHAVFIDPSAERMQRAPQPCDLGRLDHRDALKRREEKGTPVTRKRTAAWLASIVNAADLPMRTTYAAVPASATAEDSAAVVSQHAMPAAVPALPPAAAQRPPPSPPAYALAEFNHSVTTPPAPSYLSAGNGKAGFLPGAVSPYFGGLPMPHPRIEVTYDEVRSHVPTPAADQSGAGHLVPGYLSVPGAMPSTPDSISIPATPPPASLSPLSLMSGGGRARHDSMVSIGSTRSRRSSFGNGSGNGKAAQAQEDEPWDAELPTNRTAPGTPGALSGASFTGVNSGSFGSGDSGSAIPRPLSPGAVYGVAYAALASAGDAPEAFTPAALSDSGAKRRFRRDPYSPNATPVLL